MNRERITAIRNAVQCGPFLVREIEYSSGTRYRRHAHERTQVTLVLGGVLREVTTFDEEHAAALSVGVKPAGVEHEDHLGPHGATTIQVQLDSDWEASLADWKLSAEWRWIHGDRAAAGLLGLVPWLRAGDVDGELESAVHEALANVAHGCPQSSPKDPPSWLRHVRQSVVDRGPARLTVQATAVEAGVHPVYLARMYRRFFGVTVTAHVRQLRVRRAAELISQSCGSLTDVAYGAGYADQSHFCREFKSVTGVTPSAFRRMTRH